MKQMILILCILTIPSMVLAQSNCPCCSEAYAQFDFWEGDWIVYDTLGTAVGENNILKLENNCILNENWTGKSGSTGKSYNYYDRTDKSWNQVWVDNSGFSLVLKGGLVDQSMVLTSALIKTDTSAYFNRIIWTPGTEGEVTQTWEVLNEQSEVQAILFKGIYRKKED